MHKILINIMIVLLLAFFCFSGCYQMGRAVGKAEHGIKKVEKKLRKPVKILKRDMKKKSSTH